MDLDLVGTGNDEAFDRLREYFDGVTTPVSDPFSKEVARTLLGELLEIQNKKN